MVIAVASEKEKVTEHFGHCENFNIYETDGDKILKSRSVKNPGHRPVSKLNKKKKTKKKKRKKNN
jgi:predicted Fe-Mo cluster-binding NifX family protein